MYLLFIAHVMPAVKRASVAFKISSKVAMASRKIPVSKQNQLDEARMARHYAQYN